MGACLWNLGTLLLQLGFDVYDGEEYMMNIALRIEKTLVVRAYDLVVVLFDQRQEWIGEGDVQGLATDMPWVVLRRIVARSH